MRCVVRKCDGVKPVCGECKKRRSNEACVYTDENLKRGSSSYVDSLRARIKELEGLVEPQSLPRSSSGNGRTSISHTVALHSRRETAKAYRANAQPAALSASDPDLDSTEDQDDDSWVGLDGMGPQGGTPPTGTDD